MSGGVDSSVAASLLLQQRHEVIGVFMRHGEESARACATADGDSPLLPLISNRADHKQGCCSASDAEDARRVADVLDIPFYALNLQGEFAEIIDYFVDEYSRARTPNPCVVCNTWLKFGKLFEYADSVGAEFVATGHYARRLTAADGCPSLHRGVDLDKDQSYVLFGINRDRLRRMLLPLGEYHKPEIRRRAAELGLRVADKRDSQEICFVTSGHHAEFVRARQGDVDTSGNIVTTAGQVVGRHEGFERFTIGQRKGLGVGMGERYFVVRIDERSRDVVIGRREELARRTLVASKLNWLVDPPPGPFRCEAMIRYNSPATPAVAETIDEDQLQVSFEQPRFGVAPGQAVVCYDGDRVLGGGWIDRTC
jgi:tRNA-specific 2-thiouridylase